MFLMENGIISGMPDGSFLGGEAMTRYQTAVALYKSIKFLEGSGGSSTGNIDLVTYQMNTLKSLVESMAVTTEKLGKDYQALLSKIAALEVNRGGTVYDDSKLLARITALENSRQEYSNRVSILETNVSDLQAKSVDQRNIISLHQNNINELQLKATAYEQSLVNMQGKLDTMTWVAIGAGVGAAVGIGLGIFAIVSIPKE